MCRSIAPFSSWDAREYLRDFYTAVEPDERHTMRYLVERLRDDEARCLRGSSPARARGAIVCYGCGPALHHAFPAVPHTDALYLADYLPDNLRELEAWRRGAPEAHDWSAFVRYTLACENDGLEPRPGEVATREAELRRRIAGVLATDAGLADPLGPEFRGFFATVIHAFCADSATDDETTWMRYSHHIASLVRPGGVILTAALRRCRAYRSGGKWFPGANIDERDLRRVLEADFLPATVEVEIRDVPEHRAQGYEAILLATGQKADP